jgi:hypothetical protein
MAVPTQSPIAIERRSGCHGRETPAVRSICQHFLSNTF